MVRNSWEIVDALRSKHPEVSKDLCKAPTPKKRKLTPQMMGKITEAARQMTAGRDVRVLVQTGLFQAKVNLHWDGDDGVGVFIRGYEPDHSSHECELLQHIWQFTVNNYTFDDLRESVNDDVFESKEFKTFRREVKKFCKLISKYEEEYDFDYDNAIGLYSKHT